MEINSYDDLRDWVTNRTGRPCFVEFGGLLPGVEFGDVVITLHVPREDYPVGCYAAFVGNIFKVDRDVTIVSDDKAIID
jgi:hypothetical protein